MKGVFDMKRNIPIRVAVCLLIGTLLSTSMVSGTFAKYVVQDSSTDTARVAKFGVSLESSGTLFSDTYRKQESGNTPGKNGDSTGYTTLTVVSSSVKGTSTDHDGVNGTDKVVAPGTKNTDGLTFSVTGTPEVAVKVTFDVEGSDVWLGAGTYPDMTLATTYNDTYEATDTFTASDAYYPIKYTLSKQNGVNTDKTPKWETVTNYVGVTLNDIVTYLNTLCSNDGNIYDANTNLATAIGTYKLTWKWDFENTYSANLAVDDRTSKAVTAGTYDPYDTLLGDLSADKVDGTSLVSTVIGKITAAATKEASEQTANATELEKETDKNEDAINAAKKAAEAATAVAGISAPISSTGLEASANNYSTNADFTIKITVTQVD
jgi:hypothetical protein